MFFWISIVMLIVYYNNGWTTIGPGLAFCLGAMIAEAILKDVLKDVNTSVSKLRRRP